MSSKREVYTARFGFIWVVKEKGGGGGGRLVWGDREYPRALPEIWGNLFAPLGNCNIKINY